MITERIVPTAWGKNRVMSPDFRKRLRQLVASQREHGATPGSIRESLEIIVLISLVANGVSRLGDVLEYTGELDELIAANRAYIDAALADV